VDNAAFIKHFFGTWEATPEPELVILRMFHLDTELYDLTVCNGAWTDDGVLPANHREAMLCSRYATDARHRLMRTTGINSSEWIRLNKLYLQSWQYRDDMTKLFAEFRRLDADSLRALLASNVRTKLSGRGG
jgi:hypothetical protein